MMRKSTVIKKLEEKFPGIHGIMDAEEWGDYDTAIHLGDAAEGGEIDGLSAADYYAPFGGVYDNEYGYGVHEKLAAFLDKCGYFCEWHDPGTLLAFPK